MIYKKYMDCYPDIEVFPSPNGKRGLPELSLSQRNKRDVPEKTPFLMDNLSV